MGRQVQSLNINGVFRWLHRAISLGTLFPKISSIQLIDTYNDTEIGPTYEYELATAGKDSLASWKKQLESLKEWPVYMNVATCLLSTGLCNNLKNLEISFRDYEEGLCHREKLEELLKNIHNAPSLQQITFSETAININDMDSLHDSLPNLQKVKLDIVYLNTGDRQRGNKGYMLSMQHHLQAFSISFHSNMIVDVEAEGFESAVVNWMKYISKYYSKSLQNLEIEYLDYACTDLNKRNMKQALITTVPQLTQLKSLALINFYPLSKDMLQAMATAGIRLDKLKLHMENANDDEFDIKEGMLNILAENATPISSIHTLEICKKHVLKDILEVKHGLVTLSPQLHQLLHLAINIDISTIEQTQDMFDLLTGILQNMSSLETLEFGLFEMHRRKDDQLQLLQDHQLDVTATRASRLRKLSISARSYIRHEGVVTKMNITFHQILHCCPNLEEFELDSSFYFLCTSPPTVGLLLDFSDNPNLKRITVKKLYGGLKGYAFSSAPGKHWKNDHAILPQEDEEQEEVEKNRIGAGDDKQGFIPTPTALRLLNLAWRQDQSVVLDLADCTSM